MAKKKWQVIKNTTRPDFTGLDVDGQQMRFRRNGTFVIDAPGLASDIDKTFGRRGNQTVAVIPYNDHETREVGHTYTFRGVDTARMRRQVEGKTKKINGVTYRYVRVGERLTLQEVSHAAG